MFKKILIGVNDRPESEDAVALGRLLAGETGAEIVLVASFPRDDHIVGSGDFERLIREDSEPVFDRAAQRLGGLEVRTLPLGGDSPPHALDSLAEREQADLILVGSTHRGKLGRVLPGSVGERLLAGAPCPVGVAPRGYADRRPDAVGRIAVAYDGLPEAEAALQAAIELATATGASLRLLTVVEAPGVMDGYRDFVHRMTRRAQRRLDDGLAGVPPEISVDGELVSGLDSERLLSDAAAALAAKTASGVDLLIMGSRGYGPVRRVLLGGVSARVMREARCPVVVVPRSAHDRRDPLGSWDAAETKV